MAKLNPSPYSLNPVNTSIAILDMLTSPYPLQRGRLPLENVNSQLSTVNGQPTVKPSIQVLAVLQEALAHIAFAFVTGLFKGTTAGFVMRENMSFEAYDRGVVKYRLRKRADTIRHDPLVPVGSS